MLFYLLPMLIPCYFMYSYLFGAFTVSVQNPFKIAFEDEGALLSHTITLSAVNASNYTK